MAAKSDAERLTGLQTGGIGALALIGKPFDVYIDASALDQEHIYVNGGRRGLNLLVSVRDLLNVTGARLVSVAGRVT
jgi:Cys-tRNA(Pro)/Cys-tRNA(Cys) deacylase